MSRPTKVVATGRGYKGRGLTMDAQPNMTHLALAALVRCGLVQEWLTTNYDGLAQKAGCPQEKVAELHGSWFDPANPILGKGGKMRQDLALRLGEAAETADLVLVLGSSLSGGPSICAASRPQGWAINIIRCIVCPMFCVLKNIVKNIDVDVFSKTSPKHRIVKRKARCFT